MYESGVGPASFSTLYGAGAGKGRHLEESVLAEGGKGKIENSQEKFASFIRNA